MIRRAPATVILALLILGMFGRELVLGATTPPGTVAHALKMTEEPPVLVGAGAIYSGMNLRTEAWRFLASMFVHIGWIHLAFNLFSLVQIGYLLEGLFGSALFTFAYLTSGLFAGVVSFLMLGHDKELMVLAGASGAIFGVLGTLIVLIRRAPGVRERHWARGVSRQLTGCAMFNIAGGLLSTIVATLASSQYYLGNSAHISGFAMGLAIGFLPVHLKRSPASEAIVARFERPPLDHVRGEPYDQ